jgi:hypothetical protein
MSKHLEWPWVAMGSSLSPVTVTFFMEDLRTDACNRATHKPLYCFWYVQDIVIWPCGPEHLDDFLPRMSSIHNNIHFTLETEVVERQISLPNICVNRRSYWKNDCYLNCGSQDNCYLWQPPLGSGIFHQFNTFQSNSTRTGSDPSKTVPPSPTDGQSSVVFYTIHRHDVGQHQ